MVCQLRFNTPAPSQISDNSLIECARLMLNPDEDAGVPKYIAPRWQEIQNSL